MDDAQLERYAQDMKRIVLRERDQARQVELLLTRVQVCEGELRDALESERQHHLEIQDSHDEVVMRLCKAIALRHHEEVRLGRLSQYCDVLSRSLSLSESETHQIALGAPLHDIGVIGISDAILLKPGPLTAEETASMRRHCQIGADLLRGSSSPLIETARQIALTHHEHWDGSGYPHGLAGTDIPLCGRIVKLIDIYDALRSARPCKAAMPHTQARKIILEGNGRLDPSHVDPELLLSFERCEREFDEIFEGQRGGES